MSMIEYVLSMISVVFIGKNIGFKLLSRYLVPFFLFRPAGYLRLLFPSSGPPATVVMRPELKSITRMAWFPWSAT